MQFTTKFLAFGMLALSTSMAMAEDTTLSKLGLSFAGNAAVTSDYRFRGMTQTLSDPAVQASFTLAHKTGVYFSAFGSNVNFGVSEPHLELDPSVGVLIPLNISDNFKPTLDIGAVVYNYPSATEDFNWTEGYIKLTIADVGVKGSSLLTNVNYTDDWADVGGKSWNVNVGYSAPIADTGFGALANVGYTTMDKAVLADGTDDYVDWKVAVNYAFKSVQGLSAELAAVGTNIDTEDLDHQTERGLETGAVFTLTKAF